MEELVQIIQEMQIPFAYDHFAEGESPDPPFICYLIPGSNNFAADGRVYFKLNEMWVHSPPLGAQANFNRIEKHDTM